MLYRPKVEFGAVEGSLVVIGTEHLSLFVILIELTSERLLSLRDKD